ncbi:MAG: TIGR03905 family TSCPD domain-containing protein [Clostridia bacterium]|nr:TIGR03905 family TSCPD domain-containing protein [Clostridia bacterium]
MKYSFQPKGVCSAFITFNINDGILSEVIFKGGCDGNLKAISKLVEGMKCETVVKILKGNDCRGRGTSCADQLAIAIEQAMENEKQ